MFIALILLEKLLNQKHFIFILQYKLLGTNGILVFCYIFEVFLVRGQAIWATTKKETSLQILTRRI